MCSIRLSWLASLGKPLAVWFVLCGCITAPGAEIHDAAAEGNLARTKTLLTANTNVLNLRDADGKTALHYAAAKGHLAVVEFLVEQKAALDIRSKSGMTPLSLARGFGHKAVADYLAKQGPARTPAPGAMVPGQTSPPPPPPPLIAAMSYAQYDLMMDLVRRSPEQLNVKDAQGWTALHLAAMNAWATASEILVTNGAALDIKLKNGDTALHVAVSRNNHQMAGLILRHGAPVDATNNLGRTPLFAAVAGPPLEVPLTVLLLEFKANPNVTDRLGSTPLMVATEACRPGPMLALLRAGANPNVREPVSGMSLLQMAAVRCPGEIVEMLVTNRADLQTVDAQGNTVLDLAQQAGRQEIVSLLTRHGAKTAPPKPVSDAERSVVDYFKRTDQLLRKGTVAEKRQAMLSLMASQQDVEKAFLKNTVQAWKLAEEQNNKMRTEFESALKDFPDSGEIVKIEAHPAEALTQAAQKKGMLSSSVPAYTLHVWRRGEMSIGPELFFVNQRWVMLPRLDLVFPELSGPLRDR